MSTKISLDKVIRVYSGRPGCMCGCRGKYFHPEHNPDTSGTWPTSKRMVSKVVNMMNNYPQYVETEDSKLFNEVIHSFSVGPNRTYVVYESR